MELDALILEHNILKLKLEIGLTVEDGVAKALGIKQKVMELNMKNYAAPPPVTMDEIRDHAIMRAIHTQGSISGACRQLKVGRATIYKHLRSMRVNGVVKTLSVIALLLSAWICALGQSVTIAWDPSPDATNRYIGYRFYGSTNALTYDTRSNAFLKLDVGTNRIATASNIVANTYWFYATAYTTNGTNKVESTLSDTLIVTIPKPPPNMKTFVMQWIGDIATTNWMDGVYFRLKIGP